MGSGHWIVHMWTCLRNGWPLICVPPAPLLPSSTSNALIPRNPNHLPFFLNVIFERLQREAQRFLTNMIASADVCQWVSRLYEYTRRLLYCKHIRTLQDSSTGVQSGKALSVLRQATSWRAGVWFWDICLYSAASRPDLGSAQPISCLPTALYPLIKRPGLEGQKSRHFSQKGPGFKSL